MSFVDAYKSQVIGYLAEYLFLEKNVLPPNEISDFIA